MDGRQVVFGNYGELIVERFNPGAGEVVTYKPSEEGSEYADIERVDIPDKLNDGGNTDILFCGLWFKVDGVLTYEPPCWKPDFDGDGNVVDYTEAEREALKAEKGTK